MLRKTEYTMHLVPLKDDLRKKNFERYVVLQTTDRMFGRLPKCKVVWKSANIVVNSKHYVKDISEQESRALKILKMYKENEFGKKGNK